MHVYQPLFLTSAIVPGLGFLVLFFNGLRLLRRDDPGPNIGLPLILVSLIFAGNALILASRSCDPHLPSTRTLVLFGFSAGLIVAAVVSGAVCLSAGLRRRPPG